MILCGEIFANEAIINGTFESGSDGWDLYSYFYADTNYDSYNFEPGYAYLSNSDGTPGNGISGWIYQTVTIPASAVSPTLIFYYSIKSTTYDSGDFLNVTIQDTSGNFLGNIIYLTGADANSNSAKTYTPKSYDMSAYAGQTVRINFLGCTNSNTNPTIFRIDDVSLTYTPYVPPASKPDLVINNLAVNPESGANSSNATVSYTVYNQGALASTPSTSNIQINTSQSNVVPSDTSLDYPYTPSIAVGEGYQISRSVVIPADRPLGSNYIWVRADSSNAIDESDETNNNTGKLFTVTTASNPPANTASLLIDDVKVTGTTGGTIPIYDDDVNSSLITSAGPGNIRYMGLPNNGVDNISNIDFNYLDDKIQGNYSWKTDILKTGLQWCGVYLISSEYMRSDWPQHPGATGANLSALGGTITLSFKAKITGATSATAIFGLGDDTGTGDSCGKIEGGPYTVVNSWTTYSIDLTGKDLSNVNELFYYAISEDVTSPTSFNLSSPLNNAAVDNALPTFTWGSSSDPESGLSGYKLYIDGYLVKTVDKDTTSATIQTPLTTGAHTWYVVARDNIGFITISPIFNVNINPVSSTDNPPSISITEPEEGAIVHEAADIKADATDDKGIAKVEFYINNELKCTRDTAPYLWHLDTIGYANGLYTIKVIAYDTSNQTKTDEHKVTLSREFKVNRDGYQFENYSDQDPNDDWDRFVDAFGKDKVYCSDGVTKQIEAKTFYEFFISDIRSEGFCYGISISSLLFYIKELDIHDSSLADPPVSIVYLLGKGPKLDNLIEKYHWYQYGDEEQTFTQNDEHRSPKKIFDLLKDNFEKGNTDPWILSMYSKAWFFGGGHTVVPWKVVENGSKGEIYIYDSNYPNSNDRVITVDLLNDKWEYKVLWNGDANDKNLWGTPYSIFKNTPIISKTRKFVKVQGNANLCFTDSLGRQLGFKDGVFKNEIPGAGPLPTFGGESSYEIYSLPKGDSYLTKISGIGDGKYIFKEITDSGMYQIVDAQVNPNSADSIEFIDSKLIYTTEDDNKQYSVYISTGLNDNTERSYVIENTSISKGDDAAFQVNKDKEFEYTNEGKSRRYNLKLIQTGNNPGEFIADNINVGSNEKHIIKPQKWDNLNNSKVEIQIDKNNDGIIDDTQIIENGFNVDVVVYTSPDFKAYCYPNPSSGITNIKYSIPGEGIVPVCIDIYSLTGEKVYSYSEDKAAGYSYTIIWDGRNKSGEALSSGIYLSAVSAGSNKSYLKIAIVK